MTGQSGGGGGGVERAYGFVRGAGLRTEASTTTQRAQMRARASSAHVRPPKGMAAALSCHEAALLPTLCTPSCSLPRLTHHLHDAPKGAALSFGLFPAGSVGLLHECIWGEAHAATISHPSAAAAKNARAMPPRAGRAARPALSSFYSPKHKRIAVKQTMQPGGACTPPVPGHAPLCLCTMLKRMRTS